MNRQLNISAASLTCPPTCQLCPLLFSVSHFNSCLLRPLYLLLQNLPFASVIVNTFLICSVNSSGLRSAQCFSLHFGHSNRSKPSCEPEPFSRPSLASQAVAQKKPCRPCSNGKRLELFRGQFNLNRLNLMGPFACCRRKNPHPNSPAYWPARLAQRDPWDLSQIRTGPPLDSLKP